MGEGVWLRFVKKMCEREAENCVLKALEGICCDNGGFVRYWVICPLSVVIGTEEGGVLRGLREDRKSWIEGARRGRA